MTQAPTPGPGGNAAGKSSSARRSRANRNRPVLVTSMSDAPIEAKDDKKAQEQLTSSDGDSDTAAVNQAVEETKTTTSLPRRLPKFFSTVGKAAEKPEVDPAQARLARATAGKAPVVAKESKQQATSAPVKSAPARTVSSRSVPARPAGAFKMKYLFGMLLYLIIADLIGTFETNYLTVNKMNYTLFSIGSFPVTLSTVLFLLTLIVVLIVLARFDLIPRNLAGFGGQQPAQRKTSQTKSTSEPGSIRNQPPAMKQGVKGVDDDLYQEYRQQQRYNQRRERKR
ncbi:MAG TPA: hypothetical protein VKV20_11720 [Ktedonobacteraceae bacterium]|jgi:hypothetical protein|nr:hypothetical protein [Ktedonobacteraceae bacterium]